MTRFLSTAYTPDDGPLGSISGRPCAGYVTTLYGVRDELHPVGHGGIDIAADEGTPVYAPAGGIVSFTSRMGGGNPGWEAIFGNSVIIAHGDCYSLYAHFRDEPRISVGAEVNPGTFLGVVGSTGYSTGPHLHWSVAPKGNPYLNFPPSTGPVGYLIDPLELVGDPNVLPQGEFYPEEDDGMEPTKVVNADAIEAMRAAVAAVGQQDGDYLATAGTGRVTFDVPVGKRAIIAVVNA